MGNAVVQWQILARDPDKAEKFYTSLFDWKVNAANALRYRRLVTGARHGIDGGIWPAPEAGHNMVQLFIEVNDVAAYVEKATKLGASVIMPPQKIPDGDEMAVILDPIGIPFAFYKPVS
jgi:predicted enzyme related to lactoylglutathione lyase